MQSLHNVFYRGFQVDDIGSDSIICIIEDTDIRYSGNIIMSDDDKKMAEQYFSDKHGYDVNNVEFLKTNIDRNRGCCQALFKVEITDVNDQDIEHVSDCLDRSRIIQEEIQSLDEKIKQCNDELERLNTLKDALESHRSDIL